MSSTQNKNDYIDIQAILTACLKKWYLIAGCILFTLGIAVLYILRHNDEYIVKANMLISSPDDALSEGPLGAIFGSGSNVNNELYTVASHTLLCDVAKELRLDCKHIVKDGFLQKHFEYADYPIDVTFNPAIADTLRKSVTFIVKVDKKGLADAKVKIGKDEVAEIENAQFPVAIDTDYGKFTLIKTTAYKPDEDVKTTIIVSGYDMVAEDLAKDIEIDVTSRKADVIGLEMETTDITYGRDVLNAIINQYNKRTLLTSNQQNQSTLDFLNSRLDLLAADLTDVEGDLQNLKTHQGVADLGAEIEYQFTKKGKIEAELIAAETQYEVSKLISEFVSDPANRHSMVPQMLVNQSQGEATGSVINNYNNLILHRMRIAQTASPDNKALKSIDDQLEAIRANLLTSLNQALESSRVTVRELRSKYGSAQSALNNVPAQERAYRDVKRQQSIKEQLYVFLLKQREQVSMLLANTRMKGQVIDEAYALNEPIGMSNKAILVISFILGLVLGLLCIYISSLLRTKFSDRQELEKLTDAPILGEMCTNRSEQSLVVREGGSSTAAELFRLIRANLLFVLNGEDNKVVLMTSTKSGEGKSFIAINLASSLALLGKKVLLVGMDIRNPRLAAYLDLPATPGLTEYISSDKYSLDQVIRHVPAVKGMDVIVGGPIPPNPAELLNSERVDQLFAKLREMYDYIIVDSAPVGVISDTFALSRISDATIYVCRANLTTKAEISYFNSLYADHRLNKLSLVLNGTAAKQGYGYGSSNE